MTAAVEPGAGEWPPAADVVVRLRAAGCVFAEDEAALLIEAAATDPTDLERLVASRVAGEPLEQLLGWVAFGGRRVAVGPGVFVPRVRTEFLAERALALTVDGAVVVELCCGVGAVAAMLQAGHVGELYAADIDPEAVDYARRNVADPGVVLAGDLFDPLPSGLRGRIDVIVANAPYVPTEAIALMPREARDHEPRVALDGGADGVDVQRRIIAEAPGWLRAGGSLLIETGREQSVITAGEMRAAGLTVEVVVDDERDATVVIGTSSPMAEVLGRAGARARERLVAERLAAPELIDLELTSVLRNLTRAGKLSFRRAQAALDDLGDLPLERAGHRRLTQCCWDLRENLTTYDAAYVALAELLSVPLIAADARLARAPGLPCEIEVLVP